MHELQEFVDDLADQYGRPVTIDDRQGRLLVHSSHAETTDMARTRSILMRRVPEELVEWTRAQGVDHSDGPIVVPGKPEFSSASRLIVPLRCQGLLLGYLSVIDADGTIGERDVEAYASSGATAAEFLYRERLLHEVERSHEQALVHDVLFGDAEQRDRAAGQLVAQGLLTASPVVTVVFCWPAPPSDVDDPIDIAVRRALSRTRRMLAPGSAVQFARAGRAIWIVHPTRLKGTFTDVRECARRVIELAHEYAERSHDEIRAGLGREVRAVADSSESHDQAVRALQVSDRLPAMPAPVSWSDLGVNRILSLVTLRDELLTEIAPGCRELLSNPDHAELVHTVERYLELGCDIKATAAELSLHRTSVYSRLQKAERITGLQFKSGENRLELHLSLRLLRLAGEGS